MQPPAPSNVLKYNMKSDSDAAKSRNYLGNVGLDLLRWLATAENDLAHQAPKPSSTEQESYIFLEVWLVSDWKGNK